MLFMQIKMLILNMWWTVYKIPMVILSRSNNLTENYNKITAQLCTFVPIMV